VRYVKNLKPVLTACPNLLTIKASTTFGQTYKKIKKTKLLDFIYVEKPKATQMVAIVINRLLGKKFFWIQSFENPPTPSFITKLLLNQADRIIVEDKKYLHRLKKLGIPSRKLRLG